ncbi:hypothetical protein VB10N_06180 [Vibrio sp. 10N]|nr:hypothetical protein VB10N_06180 [Vibrio sp. 10N]
MNKDLLIDAHKGMNNLLKELALGLPRTQLESRIVKLTERLFPDKRVSILSLDEATECLHTVAAPNLPIDYNQAINGIAIGETVGSCGAAAFLKRSVIVDDVTQHRNWQPFLELAASADIRACWSVPVMSTEQHCLGTFALYSSTPATPRAIEVEVLESVAAVYSVALEKYALEDKLTFQAQMDPLTHCLNRRELLDRVEQSHCFDGNILGCFFVDIDKFKQVNDEFGHYFGDKVLMAVANELKAIFPPQAVLGRYGGDEFLAFCCFPSEEGARAFYETLTTELNKPVTLEETNISVSVGFATKECCSDLPMDKLIRKADAEMYKVKRRNRRTVPMTSYSQMLAS